MAAGSRTRPPTEILGTQFNQLKNLSLFATTGNAANGLKILIAEKAAKREIVLILLTTALFIFEPNQYSFAIFTLSFVLLAIESINTSIEGICDHVTPQIHPNIKKIKDVASTSMLVISTLIFLIFVLFLAKKLSITDLVTDELASTLARTKEIIAAVFSRAIRMSGEYLFFLGSTLISLLLLRNRRWILAALSLFIGVVWVLFHRSATAWLGAIGADSFSEAANFDWNEAQFYLSTAAAIIQPYFSLKFLLFYTLMPLFLYASLRWIRKHLKISRNRFAYLQFVVAILFIAVSIQLTFYRAFAMFMDNSNVYIKVAKNFTNAPPELAFKNTDIKLVIYVGESTSIMNMSLYGYPRSTTPELDKMGKEDENLLVFHNVFSTHTHTSPSLLEALSVGINDDEKFLPITSRGRISLIDILHKNNIKSFLFSNQGSTGTWNLASSIIFKNAERIFSTDSRFIGNMHNVVKKPPDHDFFNQNLLPTIENLPLNESAVIFLHAYAGHGAYRANIPAEFRNPVDSFIKSRNPKAIVGSEVSWASDVEAYDSAIKYIDFCVTNSLKSIKNLDQPIVLLYSADHGESVYSGRGHDSSRLIHEMARVPFVIYFNESARKKYPDLYAKYEALSEDKRISTLAQLPSTILDILGASLPQSPKFNPVIGMETLHPPIIVRDTPAGTTYVNLNERSIAAPSIFDKKFIDKTDDSTRIFVISRNNQRATTKICYHRSNSIGKAIRGSLIADCLEIDLVVEADGKLNVYHPAAENVKLELDEIVKVAEKNKLALWIDGKNLTSNENCERLSDLLIKTELNKNGVLIEFPSNAIQVGVLALF